VTVRCEAKTYEVDDSTSYTARLKRQGLDTTPGHNRFLTQTARSRTCKVTVYPGNVMMTKEIRSTVILRRSYQTVSGGMLGHKGNTTTTWEYLNF
jgi:hypothetical protein